VNAEGDIGIVYEEAPGVYCPGARSHQARGTDQACLERPDYRCIDRMAHPKIIGVDEQQTSIVRVS
jgi:hypothetical protein